MAEHQVEDVAVERLTPAPWNPRSSKDERFQNDGSRGVEISTTSGPPSPLAIQAAILYGFWPIVSR